MESELKNTVINYLENADEKLLKMIKALIESYEEESEPPGLSEEQYKEIDRRREAYLEDPADSYTWEQVKESIQKASEK